MTTTGRGALPSPRCGHTLSLTGAGDSSSRHLVVAFGETTKTKERKFFNDVYALSNGINCTLLISKVGIIYCLEKLKRDECDFLKIFLS